MFVFVFLLSFCSVSYQVLFSYIISDISEHSRVFVYSLTAGVYFLSLGLGAYLQGRFYSKEGWGLLVKVEALLVLLAPLSLFGIYFLAILFPITLGSWVSAYLGIFYYKSLMLVLFAQIFVCIIGILSGFELPIFLKYLQKTGLVIFLNYSAGLLAGIFLPLFLIPKLDFFGTFLLVVYCNFFVLAYLTYLFKKTMYTKYLTLLVVLSLMLLASTFYKDKIFNFYLKTRYFSIELNKNNSLSDVKNIFDNISDIKHFRTKYQSVDIVSPYVTRNLPEVFKTFSIFLDQKPQIDLFDWRVYHESMVEGSVNLFNKKPKKILVLGAGDGLIVSQILKFIPNCEKIDWVELDLQVLNFFKNLYPLSLINQKVFSSKKVNIHIDDAFHFLKNTKNKYNAVFIDFPFPFNQDLSRLYSVEFYKLLKKVLLKKSYIVADVLVVNKKENIIPKKFTLPQSIVSSTLRAAGFKSLFFYGKKEPFLFAQLTQEKLLFDYSKLSNQITLSTKNNLQKLSAKYLNIQIKSENINSIFKPLSFIP